MDHGYFLDRVSAYFDRDLPPQELALMEEHLQTCAECQALLKRIEKLDHLVQQKAELGGDDYWERSARRIEERLGKTEKTDITDIRPTRRFPKLAWKVAAVAASLVLLGYLGMHKDDIFPQRKLESPSIRPRSDDQSVEGRKDLGKTQTRPEESTSTKGTDATQRANEPEYRTDEQEDSSRGKLTDKRLRTEEQRVKTPESKSQLAPAKEETLTRRDSEVTSREALPPAAVASIPPSVTDTSFIAKSAPVPESTPDEFIERDSQAYVKAAKALSGNVGASADETAELATAASRTEELVNWRHQRDSLSTILAELDKPKSKMMQPSALTQGLTSKQETTKPVREELERALLEACFNIAKISQDTLEIRSATDLIQKVADDAKSPNHRHAIEYLDRLKNR